MKRIAMLCGALLASACLAGILSPARSEQPFDYFSNSYSVVGLKDYETGVRIMPDNTFAGIQIKFGQALKPLTAEHKKTLLNGWMPIVVIKAEESGVNYESTIWVSPLPTAKDWKRAFDWPTEGEKYMLWAVVEAANQGNAPAEAKASIGPSNFTWTLPPGKSARGVLRKPFGANGDFETADADVWLRRTIAYWQGVRDKAPRIEVPEKKATDAFWAALAYQLISNDTGKFRPGEGFWDNYWIRDGASIEMQYEEVGMWDVVKKGFDYMFQWQHADGEFDCGYDGQQGPELDGNGQAIWSFWQYYQISHDKEWLAEHYPKVRKAVDWMTKARKKDAGFPGLLPGAPADGENLWDGKHHIVGYDFWNLRGLICAADMARILDQADDVKEFEREIAAYRAAIDNAQKKTGLAHFPPSWEKDGTSWGNTETLWPTPIFQTNDPRVTATIKFLRQEFGGGYIEGTLQWGGQQNIIHSYLGSFTTMCSVRQGDHEKAVEDFYWYLLHSTASNGFAELIYFKDRKGGNETIPHTWGGCNYALLLRHMLVDERGDELHLLSAVPDWWLENGKEIRVEKAPTHFGELTFIVRGTAAGVDVQLVKPERNPPKKIVLYLPKSRPPTKPIEGVEVVAREPQKARWSFPHVVSLYTKSNDLNRPVYEQFLRNESITQLDAKAEGLEAAESPVFCEKLKFTLLPPEKTQLHYTLDGSDPTAQSPLYSGPLTIGDTTTVKARTRGADGKLSSGLPWACTCEYQPFRVEAAGPILPWKSQLIAAKGASLSFRPTLAGGTVRYTFDGKTPDEKSPACAGPIVLDKSVTVTARCFDAANKPCGRIWQETYTLADFEQNLAAGKPVKCSGTAGQGEEEEKPEYANDGWVLSDRLWGAWKPPQWWQVDLEKTCLLDRVHVFPWWTGGNRAYQYTIEVSVDEKNWTKVVDASGNKDAAIDKGTLHKFNATQARYVRVNMLKNSVQDAVQLVELRVYEAGK